VQCSSIYFGQTIRNVNGLLSIGLNTQTTESPQLLYDLSSLHQFRRPLKHNVHSSVSSAGPNAHNTSSMKLKINKTVGASATCRYEVKLETKILVK
jgi:hypothetical protein